MGFGDPTELGIFISSVLLSFGGLCSLLRYSQCQNIEICFGLIKLNRNPIFGDQFNDPKPERSFVETESVVSNKSDVTTKV